MDSSQKYYLDFKELHLFHSSSFKKGNLEDEISALKSRIEADGSFNFTREDIHLLEQMSEKIPKSKKKLESILNKVTQQSFSKSTPYDLFIPKLFKNLSKKFNKLIDNKELKKWLSGTTNKTAVQNDELYLTPKLESVSRNLKNFAENLNLKKEIHFYLYKESTLLNYNFQYSNFPDEIKIFLPKELEEGLSEDELFTLSIIVISKYLMEFNNNSIVANITSKLESYFESDIDLLKEDLKKIYKKKWEDFLFHFYSIQQLQILVCDKLSIYLLGGKEKLLALNYKLSILKENFYDTEGEIFLIEDLWGEEQFSSDISSGIPDYVVRKQIIENSDFSTIYDKKLKNLKFWKKEDLKILKDHFKLKN